MKKEHLLKRGLLEEGSPEKIMLSEKKLDCFKQNLKEVKVNLKELKKFNNETLHHLHK